MRRILSLLVLGSAVAASAAAQEPAAPGETAPSPCSSAEYRQFDFWMGSWAVEDSSGHAQGTNVISRQSGGCALLEQWTSARGGQGISINFYDASQEKWVQQWVGGDGGRLHLTGGLRDGSMVLEGDRTGPNGTVRDRIRWTPMRDGRVRQEWTSSGDGGQSWNAVFVGFYRKAEPPPGKPATP